MFKEIEEPWYRPKSKSKEESASYKYSKQANTVRAKRQSGGTNLPFPNSQSVCGLYLKIDPFLYDWIYNREGNQVNIKKIIFFNLFICYLINDRILN